MPRSQFHVARALLMSLAILTSAISISWVTHAADAPVVVDQSRFELEGARMIGLSPDGRWLASTNFDMTELCVYDSGTRAERACTDLAPLEAGLRIEDVRWSPDSTRLVLAEQSLVRYVDGDLWVMDAASGELTNIADDGFSGRLPFGQEGGDASVDAFLDHAPAWSPDGTEIAFSRSHMVAGTFAGNVIAVVPASGGEAVTLANVDPEIPGVAYWGTAWAPDGESIYYSAMYQDTGNPATGVYRVSRAGGTPARILASDPDRDFDGPAVLQVSPDGIRMLVWYPRAAAAMAGQGVGVIRLFDVATGELTTLEPPGEGSEFVFVGFGATFSPDGRYLLVTTRFSDPDNQIWVIDLQTGEETKLAQGLEAVTPTAYGLTLSWAANGLILLPEAIGAATLLMIEGGATPATAAISGLSR